MLRDLRGEEGSADALRYHRCVDEQRPRRAQVRRRCAVRRWTSRHIAATSSFVGDEEERRRDDLFSVLARTPSEAADAASNEVETLRAELQVAEAARGAAEGHAAALSTRTTPGLHLML